MLWLLIALTWLHVLFAILWFGASLTINFMVIPAAGMLPPAEQAAWYHVFSSKSTLIFAAAGGGTILFGIVRGMAGGVLSSLATPYGLTWVAALVFGIALAVWGARMTGPGVERLGKSTATELVANTARMVQTGRIELAGFAVVFTMMIAMRFGY